MSSTPTDINAATTSPTLFPQMPVSATSQHVAEPAAAPYGPALHSGTEALRLRVWHETDYTYGAPVALARHVAHLQPRDTPVQRVSAWRLSIEPAADEALDADDTWIAAQSSLDCWGNMRTVFSHSREHTALRVVSQCEVHLTAGLALPAPGPTWEDVAQALRYRAGTGSVEATEFSLPSWHAPRSAALAAFAMTAFEPGCSVGDGATRLMQQIFHQVRYAPGSTQVHTRAVDVLALGQGVCQDLAHLMIAACRSIGLAARYVSGYLLTQAPPGQQRLVGADASHAWVQVWCPVNGWLAYDPTNNIPVGTHHVTLAWGRDYADVAPLRGVFSTGGAGTVAPTVRVQVEPIP